MLALTHLKAGRASKQDVGRLRVRHMRMPCGAPVGLLWVQLGTFASPDAKALGVLGSSALRLCVKRYGVSSERLCQARGVARTRSASAAAPGLWKILCRSCPRQRRRTCLRAHRCTSSAFRAGPGTTRSLPTARRPCRPCWSSSGGIRRGSLRLSSWLLTAPRRPCTLGCRARTHTLH